MLINSSRKTGKKFKEKLVNSWNRKGFMIISGKRFLAFTTLSENLSGKEKDILWFERASFSNRSYPVNGWASKHSPEPTSLTS